MTAAAFKMQTNDGYDYYEVISALQKDIRRGKEEEALFWALQLAESGFMPHLLNRLPVIANEDIGVCDGGLTIVTVQTLVDQTSHYFNKKNDAWYMMLANAILVMCRAVKTRESENFQGVVRMRRKGGWRPGIPDYAFDMHTRRGKKMGRGLQFFIDNESQPMILRNPGPNHYYDRSNAMELEGDTTSSPGSETPPEDQPNLFEDDREDK